MDEVTRTTDVYERESDDYVEKYRAESIAARFGHEFTEGLDGDRVLDVGCGPGVDAETFVDDGYDVVGLDRTPSFLDAGRRAVPEASFVRGDMRRLPFADDAFDGVWGCASFLHVPRDEAPATLREFRRVLGDGGVLHLSVKRGEESGFEADGRYFETYLPGELRAILDDAGFGAVDLSEGEGWIRAVAESA